jgi:hypothetical protein
VLPGATLALLLLSPIKVPLLINFVLKTLFLSLGVTFVKGATQADELGLMTTFFIISV